MLYGVHGVGTMFMLVLLIRLPLAHLKILF